MKSTSERTLCPADYGKFLELTFSESKETVSGAITFMFS